MDSLALIFFQVFYQVDVFIFSEEFICIFVYYYFLKKNCSCCDLQYLGFIGRCFNSSDVSEIVFKNFDQEVFTLKIALKVKNRLSWMKTF